MRTSIILTSKHFLTFLTFPNGSWWFQCIWCQNLQYIKKKYQYHCTWVFFLSLLLFDLQDVSFQVHRQKEKQTDLPMSEAKFIKRCLHHAEEQKAEAATFGLQLLVTSTVKSIGRLKNQKFSGNGKSGWFLNIWKGYTQYTLGLQISS